MLHKVFHGSRHRQLELSRSVMYASRDLKVAVSYAENRYPHKLTYVHRLIFDVKKPATGGDITQAVQDSGVDPSTLLSEADALSHKRVTSLLRDRGFDGAVDIWDFAFDGEGEVNALVVFDAFYQAELVDLEPYLTLGQ